MPRILEPHYPHIVLSFSYRGCRIEIDRSELPQTGVHSTPAEAQLSYAAWVHYDLGCAIAAHAAPTRAIAIRQAKAWIDNYIRQKQETESAD